jgi:hypothetical protein
MKGSLLGKIRQKIWFKTKHDDSYWRLIGHVHNIIEGRLLRKMISLPRASTLAYKPVGLPSVEDDQCREIGSEPEKLAPVLEAIDKIRSKDPEAVIQSLE